MADFEHIISSTGLSLYVPTEIADKLTWDAAYLGGYREPNHQMPVIKVVTTFFRDLPQTKPHAILWSQLLTCDCCGEFYPQTVAVIEFDTSKASRQFMPVGQILNRREIYECIEIYEEFEKSGGERQ